MQGGSLFHLLFNPVLNVLYENKIRIIDIGKGTAISDYDMIAYPEKLKNYKE